MAKFQLGQIVRVKTMNEIADWAYNRSKQYPSDDSGGFASPVISYCPFFTTWMIKSCGKKYKITRINKSNDKLNSDDPYTYVLNNKDIYRSEWIELIK